MRISYWSSDVCSSVLQIGTAFLPVLRENLIETAGTLNGAIRGFAAWATEGERVRQIDAILGGLNDIFAPILPAVGNIAGGMFTDRKRVGEGKSESVRVDSGGGRRSTNTQQRKE